MTLRIVHIAAEAERVAAMPVAEIASQVPDVERIALDLADVLDSVPWPYPLAEAAVLERAEATLGAICGRLDDAAIFDLTSSGIRVLPWLTPPLADYRSRQDARAIEYGDVFMRSTIARVLRQTRSGHLVTQVEQLEALALQTLRPGIQGAARSDLVRRLDDLGRTRDALARALAEAEVVRRTAHPLAQFFLVGSLENAAATLRRIDAALPEYAASVRQLDG